MGSVPVDELIMSLAVEAEGGQSEVLEGKDEATPERHGKHVSETDDEDDVDTKIEVGPQYTLKELSEKDKVLFSLLFLSF